MKRWGWAGVALFALGAALLIWRALQPPDVRILQGLPIPAHERLDLWEWLGSLALVLGAGVLGAAAHRPEPDSRRGRG